MSSDPLTESALGTSSRWKRGLLRFWVPIALVIASLGMVGVVTANHTKVLSPIDEWVYSDYLYKYPQQEVVRLGEKIGPEALNLMACYGVEVFGKSGPKCGSSYSDLSKFPQNGISSASGYTPAYFAFTWATGEAIHVVTGIDELASWRLTGGIWLAFAMVLFSFVCRTLRVPPVLTLGLGIAFISSPFAWWTYTYISTDAPSAALGLLLLIAARKFLAGRWSGWWLAILGVVSVIFKVTNILGVCFAALFLLISWLIEAVPRWRKQSRESGSTDSFTTKIPLRVPIFAAVSVILAAITQLAWIQVQRLPIMIAGPQAVQGGLSREATSSSVLGQFVNFLPNTILWNPTYVKGSTLDVLDQPLSWICVAGVLASIWVLRRTSKHRALVISTAIASIFFAPLILVALTAGGSYFDLPARYGAPIVLMFFVMAGISIRNKWISSIVLGYALALFVYVIVKAPIYAP